MGKRLRVQRRGRGSPTFKAPTHKRVARSRYIPLKSTGETVVVKATVEELVHDPGRGAPLARCRLDTGRSFYIIAPEGIAVGQEIQIGSSAHPAIGNILPIGEIPSGTFVCNIERRPGDGGKLIRASGGYASIVSHLSDKTFIKLSSRKSVYLNNDCLATIGVISGAGRTAKPFLKAGKKNAWMKAKGRVYPITRGVAMNAVSHPHGGGSHKSKSLKPTTVSRTAPPGQKVGLIAARQTGRGRRRRRNA